jgi:hypothetical protein
MNTNPTYCGSPEGQQWSKSSYSDMWENECVEVAKFPDGSVGVRDSNYPMRMGIRLEPEQWSAFCDAIRSGEV